MVVVIAVGVGLLIVMAIVVGILDAAQASAWRAIAAQRRQLGEARRRPFYLIDGGDDWPLLKLRSPPSGIAHRKITICGRVRQAAWWRRGGGSVAR